MTAMIQMKSLLRVAATTAMSFSLTAAAAVAQEQYLLHPENTPSDDKGGGIFVVGLHIPMTHPIGVVASGLRNIPGTQLNAGLIRMSDNYEPVPYLADEWSYSEDGMQFSFRLNANARFHDGEDITCTDVAFSIKTSQENHPFKPMFAPVTGVDGGDGKDCTINLSTPHPALLMALTPGLLPIVPEHIFNDGQEMPTHPRLTENVIGSGPFKLAEWNGNGKIHFVKNEDFFIEGLPYLDEVIMNVVPDASTNALGIESGQFDMVSIWSGDDIELARQNPNIKVVDKGFEAIGSIPWIQLNLRDGILSDVRVRQALWYGYDWEEYNEVVYAGQHRRQCTGIQSQSPFYHAGAHCYDRDVEKGKALLAEAGYPDGVQLTISTFPGQLQTGAEVLKRQWAEIGVDLQIDVKPDEVTMLKEITRENADFQISLVGLWNWGDPVIGVNRSYNCDNRKNNVAFSNMSWYCNEAVDAKLAEAGFEIDVERRKELYFEAQDMINADVPVIYLTNEVWFTRMQNSVQNPPDGVWGWMDSWAELWLDR